MVRYSLEVMFVGLLCVTCKCLFACSDQVMMMPPLFAPVPEIDRQIHVVNAFFREAQYLGDPLMGALWDLLDELIEVHSKITPKSLFACESIRTVGIIYQCIESSDNYFLQYLQAQSLWEFNIILRFSDTNYFFSYIFYFITDFAAQSLCLESHNNYVIK